MHVLWAGLLKQTQIIHFYRNKKKRQPTHALPLPISFYFHPSKLHIQRPVSALGIVGHSGAERAHPRGRHSILDDGLRSPDSLIRRGFLVFIFDIQVFWIGCVALGGEAKMWPQLYVAKYSINKLDRLSHALRCIGSHAVYPNCSFKGRWISVHWFRAVPGETWAALKIIPRPETRLSYQLSSASQGHPGVYAQQFSVWSPLHLRSNKKYSVFPMISLRKGLPRGSHCAPSWTIIWEQGVCTLLTFILKPFYSNRDIP